MIPDRFAAYDAAYLLGALAEADRRAYEEHLGSCARCRAAVDRLRGLPALLGTVDPADLAEPTPPAALRPRLLERVRRERRRRGLVAAAVGAVAAATLLLGVGTLLRGPADPPAAAPAAVAPERLEPVGTTALSGWVTLQEVPWGTRVTLRCAYPAADYPTDGPAAVYRLLVRGRGGAVEPVATWSAVPGRTLTVVGATAWPRAQIQAVEVRTGSGRPLLRLLR